jgi:hypothetical protein
MNLRMDEALMRRLDQWRGSQHNPPTRPAAIRQILDQFLLSLDDKRTADGHGLCT